MAWRGTHSIKYLTLLRACGNGTLYKTVRCSLRIGMRRMVLGGRSCGNVGLTSICCTRDESGRHARIRSHRGDLVEHCVALRQLLEAAELGPSDLLVGAPVGPRVARCGLHPRRRNCKLGEYAMVDGTRNKTELCRHT